jgi:DNA polymerase
VWYRSCAPADLALRRSFLVLGHGRARRQELLVLRRHILRDLPLKVSQGNRDVPAQLAALRREVESCTRCRLHETRTQAVFGEGDPCARLMFVGEAPGYNEDKQGRPFVGAAGKLLEELLASIGLSREQVFIANVLKSRPPDNRDPQSDEIDACKPYLMRQVELIRPAVICSLGNFATKLLSGNQSGITKVHGVPQLREIQGHRFHLYPIYHPAAALYTPAMLETLRADFFRLPQLIAAPPPTAGAVKDPPEHSPPADPADPAPCAVLANSSAAKVAQEDQLGLF